MNNAQQKIFFQQCLYASLIKLMSTKTLEEISIKELCETAGVSRMTYYRRYNSKEDILMQHLDECFEAYSKQLSQFEELTFYNIAISFFEFWRGEEQDFLSSMVRSGLSTQLTDRFCTYLEEIYTLMAFREKPQPFVKSFLAGGLYKMLIDWVRDGAKLPPQEMASFLAKGGEILTEL